MLGLIFLNALFSHDPIFANSTPLLNTPHFSRYAVVKWSGRKNGISTHAFAFWGRVLHSQGIGGVTSPYATRLVMWKGDRRKRIDIGVFAPIPRASERTASVAKVLFAATVRSV